MTNSAVDPGAAAVVPAAAPDPVPTPGPVATPAAGGVVSRKTAAAGVSPKVSAAALGGAVATIFWAIAAATFWKNTFSDATLAALTGATATLLSYALGYLKNDPLRTDGGQ